MTFMFRTVSILLLLASTVAYGQSNHDKAKEAAEVGDYLQAVEFIRPALLSSPNNAEVLATATEIYSELELLDSAKMYGQRLYDVDDDTPDFVRVYALALTRGGEANKASRILRQLNKDEPEVQTALYLVNALLEADSLQAAELVATRAKKDYDDSPDAYLSIGLLYFKYKPQPVYELAVQNFNKAIELDEKMVLAHFGLAECYWKMANRESDDELANELFKRSLVEWNQVGALDPRNARAWFEQGKILYLAKQYKKAVGALIRYRELRPVGTGNPIASWYLGKSFFELQQCDSAKIHLNIAADYIDSLKSESSLMVARCSFLSKDFENAVIGYQAAVASGNASAQWENKDVWYYGAALVLTGDTVRAIAAMTEAAERDPTQCSFMFRFGLLLQKKSMTAMSNRIFRTRLDNCQDSLDSRIHFFIGNNFYADSLVDSAIARYEMSLAIDSSDGYVQTRLAETYAIAGNESRARALYGEVIANGENADASDADKNAAVSAILKLCSLDIGSKSWSDIIERCSRGLKIQPDYPYLLLYTAIGYQGQGNSQQACSWYKKVLKVDPGNGPAKQNLDALGC